MSLVVLQVFGLSNESYLYCRMILDKVDPTPESIKRLVANYPENEPIAMINILRFHETTETGESGITAYQRYGANAFLHLQKTGAKILWSGEVVSAVIGNEEDRPHQIFIVEYPSVQSFLGMVMSPEYQAITHDRTISLEYGGLYASKTMTKGA